MGTLFGVLIWVGQIRGTVILFGGHKTAPKRARILLGITQCIFTLSFFRLSSKMY